LKHAARFRRQFDMSARWTRRITLAGLVAAMAALGSACITSPEPSIAYFGVPTQPAPADGFVACMDALAEGTLVLDGRWGVALAADDGSRLQVIWPAGYLAREFDGIIELVDATGQPVARVGDRVAVTGGIGVGDAWWSCGPPEPVGRAG